MASSCTEFRSPACWQKLNIMFDKGVRPANFLHGFFRPNPVSSIAFNIFFDYPLHDRDVLVTACGRICMHRKKINISTVIAGQRLGLKEVDDGIWLVSFIAYDLGYIDLERKTLQPIDNPFAPIVSPMS